MTWNYADIDGALIFNTIEECNMPMMKYNKILETEKYTFVCEPWVPNGVTEEKLNKDKDKEIQDMLEKFKDDTLNKPDSNNGKHKKTTPNIFNNLGIMEPKGMEV